MNERINQLTFNRRVGVLLEGFMFLNDFVSKE